MTAITWGTTPTNGDITRRVPALSAVNVDVQVDLLAFVNTKFDVRLFELGESDPRLKLARIYVTLHYAIGLLDPENTSGSGGEAAGGPITARSMDGVSESYAWVGQSQNDRDALFAETYWGRRYLELIRPKRFGILVL